MIKYTEPPCDIIIKALSYFINQSKNTYITISKIKQLRKLCKTTYKNCLDWLIYSTESEITYQIVYGNVYLSINISNTTYILKFDKLTTAKYFADGFNFYGDDYNRHFTDFLSNCNDTFNYDELTVKQDDRIYSILLTDENYILIIDIATRIQIFEIAVKQDSDVYIYTEDLAIKKFFRNKYANYYPLEINQLPDNIRDKVNSQIALLSIKGG